MITVEVGQCKRVNCAAGVDIGALSKSAVVVADQNNNALRAGKGQVWRAVFAEISGHHGANDGASNSLIDRVGIIAAAQSFVKRKRGAVDGDKVKNAVIIEISGDDAEAACVAGRNGVCCKCDLRRSQSVDEGEG